MVGRPRRDPAAVAAFAEIVAVPAPGANRLPEGTVVLSWVDRLGEPRDAEVVRWARLDRRGLEPGVEFVADVHARPRRHIRFPSHQVTARLVLTDEPTDRAQVMIGDPHQSTWAFGVVFAGAVLLDVAFIV